MNLGNIGAGRKSILVCAKSNGVWEVGTIARVSYVGLSDT